LRKLPILIRNRIDAIFRHRPLQRSHTCRKHRIRGRSKASEGSCPLARDMTIRHSVSPEPIRCRTGPPRSQRVSSGLPCSHRAPSRRFYAPNTTPAPASVGTGTSATTIRCSAYRWHRRASSASAGRAAPGGSAIPSMRSPVLCM
jgi:hypothetical protein